MADLKTILTPTEAYTKIQTEAQNITQRAIEQINEIAEKTAKETALVIQTHVSLGAEPDIITRSAACFVGEINTSPCEVGFFKSTGEIHLSGLELRLPYGNQTLNICRENKTLPPGRYRIIVAFIKIE